MRQARARRVVHWRRTHRVAAAVFALLLQSLAPLQIMPPRGQAVHFAHGHHGHADRQGGGDRPGAPRQDAPACPVCQALQSGGTSIHAPAPVLALSLVVDATPLPAEIEAPAVPAPARFRARAPPMSV